MKPGKMSKELDVGQNGDQGGKMEASVTSEVEILELEVSSFEKCGEFFSDFSGTFWILA